MGQVLMDENLNLTVSHGFQLQFILSSSTQQGAGPLLYLQLKFHSHWVCIKMQRPGRDRHINAVCDLDCLPRGPRAHSMVGISWPGVQIFTVLSNHAWLAPLTAPYLFPKLAAIPVHIHTLTPCPLRHSRTQGKCLIE